MKSAQVTGIGGSVTFGCFDDQDRSRNIHTVQQSKHHAMKSAWAADQATLSQAALDTGWSPKRHWIFV